MRYILFLCLACFYCSGYSQTDSIKSNHRHPYLGITLGMAFTKVKDDLVMPVRYTGSNVNLALNYLKRKPLSIQEVYINSIVGVVRTQEANIDNFGARFIEPRAQLFWGDFGYLYLHKISSWSGEKYNFFMGGNAYLFANVRVNERWDNSLINYEAAITPLSWSGRVERSLTTKKKNKKLTFSYNLNIPILSFVLRPEFNGVPDFLDYESNQVIGIGNWESFWGFPRIKSTLDMSFPIAKGNILRFGYTWDYYSYQEPVKTQSATHFITFTLLTHL